MKKITIIVLSILLILATGCTKKTTVSYAAEDNAVFKQVLDGLLTDVFGEDDYSINFMFTNPQAYGITQGLYTVGFTSETDYKDWYEYETDALAKLQAFKTSDLSMQQAMDRDALVDYIEKDQELSSYYDYQVGNSDLGYMLSTNAQLSVYLDVFVLRTQKDLDGYMNIMNTLPDYYQKYIDLEKTRQSRGTGYGQEEIDEIIDQAKTTVEALDDSYFLIASFNTRIDGVSFLSAEQKASYKEQNKAALLGPYKQAYQMLVDQLQTIQAAPTTGMANKPNGKAYYEAAFAMTTGVSTPVATVIKNLDTRANKILSQLRSILSKHPDYTDKMDDDSFKSFQDQSEMMSFLINAVNTSGDFTAVSDFSYDIRKVDESMEDNSSPAFYFTPTVDYTADQTQHVYINGDYSDSLYTTMAHEGFPGHMYQFNYFLTLGEHPIRSVFSFSGNAEGWATYAENYAVKYVEDETYADFYSLYQQYMAIINVRLDLGVNYEGYTRSDLADYFTELQMPQTDEVIDSVFLQMAHNPTNYAMYFIPYLELTDLESTAKDALGNKYSAKAFHDTVLSCGSASFDIIDKVVKQYIKDNK